MPILSLLKPQGSLWQVVRDLIDTIIPESNPSWFKPRQTKKYRKRITIPKKEEEEEQKKESEESKDDLFPKIEYNSNISMGNAVPCSMDMTMPISFSFNGNGIESQFELPDLDVAFTEPQAAPAQEVQQQQQQQEEENEDEEKEFVCHYCDAKFRIRGYLTRHIKKHALEKAYHCPFYEANDNPSKRCHNSGGFSRRDTFKTHMKARHLIYPEGVKFADRNQSTAHCARCGTFIPKASRYVEEHLESGQCPALPMGYVSENLRKSSKDSSASPLVSQSSANSSLSPDGTPFGIPTTSRKTRRRNRMRKIITSNGTCRYISTLQSWVEPKVLQNKEALEAMAIMASETGRNDVLTTMDDNKFVLDAKSYVNSRPSPSQSRKSSDYKPRKNSKVQDAGAKSKRSSKSKIKTPSVATVSPTCATIKMEQPLGAEGLISPANSTSTGAMSTSPMSQNALEPVYSNSSLTASLESIQNNSNMVKMETNNTLDNILPNMADLDKIGFDAMLAYCPLDPEQSNHKTSDIRTLFDHSNESLGKFNENNKFNNNNNNYHAETGFGIPQKQIMKDYVNDNVVMPSNNNSYMEKTSNNLDFSFDAATLTEMHIKETQKYMQYYQQFFNTN